jgi:hypothetical protein
MIDARADAVDFELFRLLKEAGTIDCLIGIESGVDRVLRLFNKGASAAKNAKAIDILRELGISLNLGFIMFDPRMTFEELQQNYGFLQKHNAVTVDSLRSWLWPLFGTPVVEELRSAGLVVEERLGEVRYRFVDARVEKVFGVISQCTTITHPLDREIYEVRKYGGVSDDTLRVVLQEVKSLWIDVFDAALESSVGFDYSWVEEEVAALLERFKSLRAAPTAQDKASRHAKIGLNLHATSLE